jgi:hypothetical protein
MNRQRTQFQENSRWRLRFITLLTVATIGNTFMLSNLMLQSSQTATYAREGRESLVHHWGHEELQQHREDVSSTG